MAFIGDLIRDVGGILRERILWVIIPLSLAVGLLAAFGREINDGRRPDHKWWRTRILVLPFFGIVTGWAVSRLNLNNNDAAILAAVLALLGYEALRMITERARQAGDIIGDKIIGKGGTPKPYLSVIDTDRASRPTAHIVLVDPSRPRRSAIGSSLGAVYEKTVNEDMPADMQGLIDKLDDGNPDAI